MSQESIKPTAASTRLLLTRLGWNSDRESQFAYLADEGLQPGRIIRVDRGYQLAQTEYEVMRCANVMPGLAMAVGDWVAIEYVPRADVLHVVHVLPRTSLLERSDGMSGAQAVAANVDIVLVVHTCDGLNSRRLERELTQVAASGASPVIILSKTDAVADHSAQIAEARRIGRNVPVIPISVVRGEGLDQVQSLFAANETAALIGPSGVGKSTLVNAVLGKAVLAIGDVRSSDGRGRHTTTARHLLSLPNGGALIDTPGMREFGLTGNISGIEQVFDDIAEAAVNCRFRDCRHAGEPGCAVAGAILDGGIDSDRLESYKKLEREQAAWRARNDPLLRKQRDQVWKAHTKGMRQREELGGKW